MKPLFLNLVLLFLLCPILRTIAQVTSPEMFNSPANTITSPSISADGNHFAFVVNTEGKSKILLSSNVNGKWSEPKPIDSIASYKGGNFSAGAPFLNYNGSVLYFQADYNNNPENKEISNFDLFYSVKRSGIWSSPIPMTSINTPDYEGSPSISPDEKTLFFVRNIYKASEKEFVWKRIYYSLKDDEGKWQTPNPLQIPINVGREEAPRICADGKTLFFASERDVKNATGERLTKGRFDLFYTKQLASNAWLDPILVTEGNTELDDMYVSSAANSNEFYFSSSEIEKKKSTGVIVKHTFPVGFKPDNNLVIKGIIKDQNTNKALEASITVSDPVSSRILAEYKSDGQTGDYFLVLDKTGTYKIDIWRKGYSHHIFTQEPIISADAVVLERNANLFSTIKLVLNVFDSETFEPLESVIKLTEAQTGVALQSSITPLSKGRFSVVFPIGKQYKINIQKENYEAYEYVFDLETNVLFDEFEKDAELKSMKQLVEVAVTDVATKQNMEVEVTLRNLDKNEQKSVKLKYTKEGKCFVEMRVGDRYEVSVKTPKGYAKIETQTSAVTAGKNSKVEIALTPLLTSTKIAFNNITFETNSADLNVSSFEALNSLLQLLKDNPELKVEISAHTDDKGTDDYNLRLSERRAQSVVSYLTDRGINNKQVLAKGYGEKSPAVPNTSEENRALNRRVEMKIL